MSKKSIGALMLIIVMLFISACAGGSGGNGGSAGEPPNGGSNDNSANAPEPEQPAEPDRVSFAYFPAFHTMVVFVAEQAGFFEEQNLDVEMIYTDRGSLQPQMLIANQADIATSDIIAIAMANWQGRDLLHVYPTSQNMSMNFVASNEAMERLGITAESSLEEKLAAMGDMRIGITGPSAPTDIYTRYLLEQGGHNPSNVEIVSLSNGGNLLAALKSGQIDGFMLTPPTPNQPELEGYGTILIKSSAGEVPELENYPYQGITLRKEWAEQNPDVVARFIRALMNAADYIRSEPEDATQYMRAYFEDMDDAALVAGMTDMIPSLPIDGLMTEDFVTHYLDLNHELGILVLEEEDIPSSEEGVLWTNDYVRMAAELE